MALTTFNRNVNPTFSKLLEDFFRDEYPFYGGRQISYNSPQVNIAEAADHFKLEVAAPGMTKGDFEIKIENNVLSVKAHKEHREEHSDGGQNGNQHDQRYIRREFTYGIFERTFTLPETVNGEGIQAKYESGILHVTLPKKDEAVKKPARMIEIQ